MFLLFIRDDDDDDDDDVSIANHQAPIEST
jgi:hypothetical protein